MHPTISIGLPVYNGEKYISETIKSILGQSFDDFEFIISDNCSTDKTLSICNSFKQVDKRIKLYRHEKNRGAASNYNFVFSKSKGKYFKWSAHDDIILPTYFEKCIEIFRNYDSYILCYPKTTIIDSSGNIVKYYDDNLHLNENTSFERFIRVLFRKNLECNAIFGLINRSMLQKSILIGKYNSSDQILLNQLALFGKFYEVNDYLFYRRDHEETSLRTNKSVIDIAKWFDSSINHSFLIPSLKHVVVLIFCVKNSDMNLIDKSKCFYYIFKKLYWQRTLLLNEFRTALSH